MNKEKINEIAFKMISTIVMAKGKAQIAFKEYKKNKDKEHLLKELKEAEKILGQVGQLHMDVVQAEAQGKDVPYSTIFLHAEDQFMTVQMMIEMLLMLKGE